MRENLMNPKLSEKAKDTAGEGVVRGRIDLVFIIEVVLGAIAAIAVLRAWLLHPAVSGDMEEAGRWLVRFLIAGVVIAATAAVLFSRDTKPRV